MEGVSSCAQAERTDPRKLSEICLKPEYFSNLECEDGLSGGAAQDARQCSGRQVQRNKRSEEENSRRCHLANRDDLIIQAFADHLEDLNDSNLADQGHLSEIENLK